MFGPNVFASLTLAASIMAPALPTRTDWVGEIVFLKKPGTASGTIDREGKFTPTGRLQSIQYVVVKDDKEHIQVLQEGKPIWVVKDDLIRLKDAVEYYTKMLDEETKKSDDSATMDTWFAFRGWARFRSGKPEEALKDYAEAIRLNPEAGSWYGNRGLIHLESKKFDEAIGDFTACIDLHPAHEVAYRNRAMAYTRKKDFAKAATDFEKVVEIKPESPIGRNGLAWLLCTAPDDKVRDGKRALEHAQKACELTNHKNGGYLDTLAAAYAELGIFDQAVEWQEKAVKAGDIPIKDLDAAKKRLEMFKKKMPYRGDE
jgi:tetratricopeptide (TPR) repeat protein